MLMKLVFVTNNNHKLKEVQHLLGDSFNLLSLKDIKCFDEIPEDHNTLEANASQKAFYVYNKLIKGLLSAAPLLPMGEEGDGLWGCFADDTGLEIEALNGRPGVFSARYAGEGCDFDANMDKVLKEMQGVENRKAHFRTVISLIIDGEERQFQGMVNGIILTEKKGERGFGYDPIFQADGFDVAFAEMSLEEKNNISHRAIAVKKLVHHLYELNKH
ncbi:non-canonical purine NTP pyrophosphatase [bacterium AH-315-M05]|nr:non-canonical purine NTP pyrophosphatase [bacterium AH-315-M05]